MRIQKEAQEKEYKVHRVRERSVSVKDNNQYWQSSQDVNGRTYIYLRYRTRRKTTGGGIMAKLIVGWLGRRKGASVFVTEQTRGRIMRA